MNDLEVYREELANCDAKITEALKERYAIIEKIMAYKEEYGMPILQPEQEEKQKKRLMFSLHNDKHRDEIYEYLSVSSATVRRSRLESFLITTLS